MYLGIRVKTQNKKLDHYNCFLLSTIVGRGVSRGVTFFKKKSSVECIA